MSEKAILSSPDISTKISLRVKSSAEKIEQHIRACGYNSGDMYLSAKELSQLLGESEMTVQRAMAYLASRHILKRIPKTGTFIGDGISPKSEFSCIHFFMPDECLSEPGLQQTLWSQTQGIRELLPNIAIQVDFVPRREVAYVKQIMQQAKPSLAGAVLVLASRQMRAYLNESGIPTVVLGSVEPDLVNLNWIAVNQFQIGQLLASYLLEKGHKRIATIMRDVWSVGEHLLHDGISDSLAKFKLAANALLIRSAPVETNAINELARSLLKEPAPPSGIICRTEFQADCVSQIAAECGMSNSVEVVVCNTLSPNQSNKYTCTVSDLGMREIGNTVGNIFRNVMNNQKVGPHGQFIPVRLCCAK